MDTDGSPLVGIALAAHRPPPGVFAEQLASIRAQTWTRWFCEITCDSPLAELREVAELVPYFEDARFRWSENAERLGHKRNFECAIARCVAGGARWIACSDQDDVWYPDKLATLAAEIAKRPALSVVHSDMHVLAGSGGRSEPLPQTGWTIERRGVHNASGTDLLLRNIVTGAAMLMDAELARRFPAIPDEFDYHDHWYGALAAFLGGVHPVARPLYAYRQHEQNVVGVTPYSGALAIPPRLLGRGLRPALDRALYTWQSVAKRARAVRRALPGAGLPRWVTWTAGAGLLVRGLVCAVSDPALTRACIRRGTGQFVALFARRTA